MPSSVQLTCRHCKASRQHAGACSSLLPGAVVQVGPSQTGWMYPLDCLAAPGPGPQSFEPNLARLAPGRCMQRPLPRWSLQGEMPPTTTCQVVWLRGRALGHPCAPCSRDTHIACVRSRWMVTQLTCAKWSWNHRVSSWGIYCCAANPGICRALQLQMLQAIGGSTQNHSRNFESCSCWRRQARVFFGQMQDSQTEKKRTSVLNSCFNHRLSSPLRGVSL
jgi:hypothetical protein